MKIAQFVSSMEDFEDDVETTEAPATDFVEAAEVETELLEVNEGAQELSEMSDEIEESEEVVEALESLISSLESIAENGGLDQNAARMYHIAQEAIYGRLGLKVSNKTSSLESFGDVSSRHTATVVSIEEEKGRLKKLIETIVKFVKEMAKKFMSWLESVFTAVGHTKKRAETLAKQIDSSKSLFEGTITDEQNANFAKKIGDTTESLDNVVASWELAVETVIQNKYIQSIADIYKAMNDKYKGSDKTAMEISISKEYIDSFTEEFNKLANKLEKRNEEPIPGRTLYTTNHKGPNGLCFYVNLGGNVVFSDFGFITESEILKDKYKEPTKVNIDLDKKSAKAAALGVASLMDDLNTLVKVGKDAVKSIDDMISNMSKEDNDIVKSILGAGKVVMVHLTKGIRHVSVTNTNASKAVLDIISLKMKEPKEQAEEEKTKALPTS